MLSKIRKVLALKLQHDFLNIDDLPGGGQFLDFDTLHAQMMYNYPSKSSRLSPDRAYEM